jgi:DNA-binding HxlR family transcriptional regulator
MAPKRPTKPSLLTMTRSPCPVAATLDLIGDKWTLLVIRDLFAGKARYKELVASPEGIATNILAARLQKLVEAGLVTATTSAARVGAVDYHLTERGITLLPVIAAMRDWGLANVPGTAVKVKIQE